MIESRKKIRKAICQFNDNIILFICNGIIVIWAFDNQENTARLSDNKDSIISDKSIVWECILHSTKSVVENVLYVLETFHGRK